MNLENLGYNDELQKFRSENNLLDMDVGRVIAEHRERYIVATERAECEAEITGNMRFTAKSREDYPAVGDWVALSIYEHDFTLIQKILPRFSIITRQNPGKNGEVQIIAANIDYAFLVQAVDRDFNINRLERYLAICNAAGVEPIILLTKTDLIAELQVSEITDNVKARIRDIHVIPLSNNTLDGYEELRVRIEKGKTYCLLGSSGAGKSTLVNNLSGETKMKTGELSRSTSKGRHVTSHRELFILDNGGILIDNPGLREVGIADTSDGLEITFDKISELSHKCKFKDCTHTCEAGCAVLEGVERGEIDISSYKNFLKMERERALFQSNLAERRRKDKQFGKIMKNYIKDMKRQQQ